MTERLFIGLWPPGAVVAQIEAALAPLQQRHADIRWQPPQRWHVTLAFLGDRDTEREMDRFRRAEIATPSPLRLSGAGCFGPILWLGVDTGPWLAQLARSLRKAHHVHERRFTPHITLGRGRSPAGRRQVARAASELRAFVSQQWTPGELTLVRSTTGPKPQYEVLARRALVDAE